MVRSPETYAGWGEEQRRDVFLLMLNSHYEGKAVVEAFNRSGKTDILIREGDRNIFIAECKRWTGEKSIGRALDQLFGYATWHDTKLALVVFVRKHGLTDVVRKGRQALEGHAQFKRWVDRGTESEARCELGWPGDPERLATLHVFFVHAVDREGARA